VGGVIPGPVLIVGISYSDLIRRPGPPRVRWGNRLESSALWLGVVDDCVLNMQAALRWYFEGRCWQLRSATWGE
jgi:hypothetical protein